MDRKSTSYKPVVTLALIAVNVLAFLAEYVFGSDLMTEIFSIYTPYVIARGEWWRLVTSTFIHFGTTHLLGNMGSLYFLGNQVEAYYGRIRFLILYLVSGIGGGLLTVILDLGSGDFSWTAGASGAIFGIMSAYIIFALNPVLRREFPLRRVLTGIAFAMLPGFYSSGISLSGHVGGFVTGLVAAFILDPNKKMRRLWQ